MGHPPGHFRDDIRGLLACSACGAVLEKETASLRCSACGATFKLAGGRAFFTDAPTDYEGSGVTSTRDKKHAWSTWRHKNFSFLRSQLESVPSTARILDVGIGPGQFGELTDRFALTVGVDFRPFEPVHVVADLTKRLPFQDNSFDVVFVTNTLEHLPDTEKVLAEIYRVLKKGGVILGTMPFLIRIHQKPYDFNRYTHYKMKLLLEQAGFSDITVPVLSAPIDVYRSIQRHFYGYVIDASGRSGNGVIRLFRKIAAKLLWRLERLILWLAGPILSLPAPTEDFTEGYGFRALK